MPQLDALRALAVGLVFISHWADKSGVSGMLGVRMFFVLSGFLITAILLRIRDQVDTGLIDWKSQLGRFYVRRFLRLFPALLLLILVLLVLDWGSIRHTWGWHLSYLSNVYFSRRGSYEGPISPLWSLSVEEQFYLVWPLFILLSPRRAHFATIVACIAVALAWRTIIWSFHSSFLGAYVLPVNWLDGLGCGALLAVASETPKWSRINVDTLRRLARNIGIPVFLACLTAKMFGVWGTATALLLELSASISFLWLVSNAAAGFSGRVRSVLEFRPLLYLGRISYGLYLYHAFVPDAFKWTARRLGISLTPWDIPQALFDLTSTLSTQWATKLSAVAMIALYSAITIGIATISWFLWERPINGLRRYVGYRKLRSQQGAATIAPVKVA